MLKLRILYDEFIRRRWLFDNPVLAAHRPTASVSVLDQMRILESADTAWGAGVEADEMAYSDFVGGRWAKASKTNTSATSGLHSTLSSGLNRGFTGVEVSGGSSSSYSAAATASTGPTALAAASNNPQTLVQGVTSVMQCYAEIVGLCYALYSKIGYQTSIGIGGQHRQRGAFVDLAWVPLTEKRRKHPVKALAMPSETANNSPGSIYLSVGEDFSSFALGAYACANSRTPVEGKGKHCQSVERNMFMLSGLSSSSGQSGQLAKDHPILPVFFIPPESEISERFLKGDLNPEVRRVAVRDALLDAMYYSQVYETIASDSDDVLEKYIPNQPRQEQRWGTINWPQGRLCYLIDVGQVCSGASPGGGSAGNGSSADLEFAFTYVGKSCFILGGDWEELGRSALPTRAVLRDPRSNKLLAVTTVSKTNGPCKISLKRLVHSAVFRGKTRVKTVV